MADYFAILGQPRRPWLDQDQLKEAFHRLAAQAHPDVAGSQSAEFMLLNTAYNTLRDPKSRLQHLLALEAPEQPTTKQGIPPEVDELFMQVGQQQHAAASFLNKYASAQSPLTKALLSAERFKILEDLERTLGVLDAQQAQVFEELRKADPVAHVERLGKWSQQLAYLGKWRAQLQETISRLAID